MKRLAILLVNIFLIVPLANADSSIGGKLKVGDPMPEINYLGLTCKEPVRSSIEYKINCFEKGKLVLTKFYRVVNGKKESSREVIYTENVEYSDYRNKVHDLWGFGQSPDGFIDDIKEIKALVSEK